MKSATYYLSVVMLLISIMSPSVVFSLPQIAFEDKTMQASSIWNAPATEKIFLDQSGQLSTSPRSLAEIRLVMAKNSYQAFQLVISAGESKLDTISIDTSGLQSTDLTISSENIRVYQEYYIDVMTDTWYESTLDYRLGLYPDALIPISSPISVEANSNQPLWIAVETPKNTDAGTYTGTITFTGDVNQVISYRVEVVDLLLPDRTNLFNPAYADTWELSQFTSSDDDFRKLTSEYTQFFADREINIGDSIDHVEYPEQIGDTWDFQKWYDGMTPIYEVLAKEFDPLVLRAPVNFAVLGFDEPEADSGENMARYQHYLTKFAEFVATTDLPKTTVWNVWIDELDEPDDALQAWLISKYAVLTQETNDELGNFFFHYKVDGTIDWNSPFAKYDFGDKSGDWESLNNQFTIWHAPQEDIDWDLDFVERTLNRGAKVIVYQQAWTALSKGDEDMPKEITNRDYEFPSVPGIVNPALFSRVLPWMVFSYGLHGIGFWATMAWYNGVTDKQTDPFEADPAIHVEGGEIFQNGDGHLVYPGQLISRHSNQADVSGPVPSLRLELLRLGFEDYKYLSVLKNNVNDLQNSQEASSLLSNVGDLVTSISNFNRNSSRYEELITNIAHLLSGGSLKGPAEVNWSITWNPDMVSGDAPKDGWEDLIWYGTLIGLPVVGLIAIVVIILRRRRVIAEC